MHYNLSYKLKNKDLDWTTQNLHNIHKTSSYFKANDHKFTDVMNHFRICWNGKIPS